LQRHLVDRTNMDFTVTVDKLPAQAGIDPLNKMIDRNPDDNIVKVTKR
jgi:ABC-2 type transport system permease protein